MNDAIKMIKVTQQIVFFSPLQHIIFSLKFALDYFIPDMPQEVQNTIKREQYLAQQALLQKLTAQPSDSRPMNSASPV